jgi:hypothetical protein
MLTDVNPQFAPGLGGIRTPKRATPLRCLKKRGGAIDPTIEPATAETCWF